MLITIGLIIALFGSLILLYGSFRMTLAEGRRPFGFYCDTCTGKYRKNGGLYFRCLIKPWILKACGVNVDQTEIQRIVPGSILDD